MFQVIFKIDKYINLVRMAGIKISQLPKWSISDVEQFTAEDILLPVSVNGVTGCLRSNTLINMLKNTPSDIDNRQNLNIDSLNERLAQLTSTLEDFMVEMRRKYNEIIANQSSTDSNQNNQINQNTSDIDNINQINELQSAQINALSEWEVANNGEQN